MAMWDVSNIWVARQQTMQNINVKLNLGLIAKAAFNIKKNLFTSKLDYNLRKKPVKCDIWSMALCGAVT
jgi:hypothetical protein